MQLPGGARAGIRAEPLLRPGFKRFAAPRHPKNSSPALRALVLFGFLGIISYTSGYFSSRVEEAPPSLLFASTPPTSDENNGPPLTSLHRGCRFPEGTQPGTPTPPFVQGGENPAVVKLVRRSSKTEMHYKVTLQTPEGQKSFECPPDQYILDQADEDDVELPYSCRAGACSACAGQVVSGSIDNSDQSFLDDGQLKSGYCLLCTTFPTSDVTIRTHCEDEI